MNLLSELEGTVPCDSVTQCGTLGGCRFFVFELGVSQWTVPVTQNLLFYYHDQCFTDNLTTGKE